MMLHCQKSQRFGHVEVPSRSRPLRGSHESRWHRIFNKVLPCYLLFFFFGIHSSDARERKQKCVNLVDLVKSFQTSIAKFGFDTAENKPLKICQNLADVVNADRWIQKVQQCVNLLDLVKSFQTSI